MSDIQDLRAIPGPLTTYNMLLRDFFAAAALQGLLAAGSTVVTDAAIAYRFADAMLDARRK